MSSFSGLRHLLADNSEFVISCSDPYSDLPFRYSVLRCIGHWAKVAETLYVSLIHWGSVGDFYCLLIAVGWICDCDWLPIPGLVILQG